MRMSSTHVPCGPADKVYLLPDLNLTPEGMDSELHGGLCEHAITALPEVRDAISNEDADNGDNPVVPEGEERNASLILLSIRASSVRSVEVGCVEVGCRRLGREIKPGKSKVLPECQPIVKKYCTWSAFLEATQSVQNFEVSKSRIIMHVVIDAIVTIANRHSLARRI